jgi:CBS domain-containing protein
MKRTVNDVMTKTVVVVRETAPYKEIVRLLDVHRVNALPVVDERGVLIGIVTQSDLLLKEEFADDNCERRRIRHRRHRRERTKAKGLVARDVMASPVITTTPEASLAHVARMLHDHGVKQVPVTDPQGKVVGIVSRRDLLRVFLRTDDEIRREVVEQIVVRTLWLDRSTVRVAVSEGVVTLQGQLDQRSLAEWLVELVEKVDGVVGVDDRLSHRIDDQAIHSELMLTEWGVFAPGARSIAGGRAREPAGSAN